MAKPRSKFKKVKWLFGKEIEIPEEWEITAQGRICQFINGYAYSQSEFREKGYPIIRIQNLTGGKNFVFSDIPLPEKQFAVNGDLLFAWSATFGPFIWHGYKAAFHYHQWKVIPGDEISKIFLYYHFTKIAPTVKQMGQSGLGMFHMTKSGMKKFPIALPPPSEQTKIASILSGVDALIESTQKVIEKTERLKKSLMQKLLTKGIGHTKFKKVKWLFGKEIEIPEEWEVKKFNEIFDFLRTGTNSRSDLSESGDAQYIHYGDIHTKWNLILECKSAKIPFIENDKIKNLSLLKDGDLIIADASEDHEGSGTSILLKNIENKQVVSGLHTIALRDNSQITQSEFRAYITSIKFVKIQIIAQVTGISVFGLSKTNLKKMKITIPLLPEQQKIASILSNADAYIQKNQEYKKKMELLKKGLMQKLLTGQIRVKVNH